MDLIVSPTSCDPLQIPPNLSLCLAGFHWLPSPPFGTWALNILPHIEHLTFSDCVMLSLGLKSRSAGSKERSLRRRAVVSFDSFVYKAFSNILVDLVKQSVSQPHITQLDRWRVLKAVVEGCFTG